MAANILPRPIAALELYLSTPCLPVCSLLLQQGVLLPLAASTGLCSFLQDRLELAPDFVAQRLATVFLNSRPVDDLEQAILRPGDTLALSAAMPGLVGATLRRRGLIAAFRSTISHRPGDPSPAASGRSFLRLKLFNLILEAVGPALLAQGVFLPAAAWTTFLGLQGPALREHCRQARLNGRELPGTGEFPRSWGEIDLIRLQITGPTPASEAPADPQPQRREAP